MGIGLGLCCCNPCITCGGLIDNPASKLMHAIVYDYAPFPVQHIIRSGVAGGTTMSYQASFSSASRQVFSGAGTPTGSPPPRRSVLALYDSGPPIFSWVHEDSASPFATAPALDESIIGGIGAYPGAAYQCNPGSDWELIEHANPTIDTRDYSLMVMQGVTMFLSSNPDIGTPDSWCCPPGGGLLSCAIDYLPSSAEMTISGFTSSGGWDWAQFNRTETLTETVDFSDANALRKVYVSPDITVSGCTWRHTAVIVAPFTGGEASSQCGASLGTSIVSGGAACTGSGGPFFQASGPGWYWCQLGCRWGWAGTIWGGTSPANPPFPVGDLSLTW